MVLIPQFNQPRGVAAGPEVLPTLSRIFPPGPPRAQSPPLVPNPRRYCQLPSDSPMTHPSWSLFCSCFVTWPCQNVAADSGVTIRNAPGEGELHHPPTLATSHRATSHRRRSLLVDSGSRFVRWLWFAAGTQFAFGVDVVVVVVVVVVLRVLTMSEATVSAGVDLTTAWRPSAACTGCWETPLKGQVTDVQGLRRDGIREIRARCKSL